MKAGRELEWQRSIYAIGMGCMVDWRMSSVLFCGCMELLMLCIRLLMQRGRLRCLWVVRMRSSKLCRMDSISCRLVILRRWILRLLSLLLSTREERFVSTESTFTHQVGSSKFCKESVRLIEPKVFIFSRSVRALKYSCQILLSKHKKPSHD
jgi:hypothetical protein